MAGFAYVVLSHRAPEQVERLTRAIRALSPDARVVITHDTHLSPPPRPLDDGVEVHTRAHGPAWGRMGLVDAVLERLVDLDAAGGHEWVAVISGQDFPVRPLAAWEDEVRGLGANAVIHSMPIAERMRWGRDRDVLGRVLSRYEHRHFHLPNRGRPPSRTKARARWVLQWLASQVGPVLSYSPLPDGGSVVGVRRLRSPFSAEFPCRKGSQWLALDRAAVRHLLDVDRAGHLRPAYETSLIPDESYIQTIVTNAPHLRVARRAVTADRFEPPGNPHPITVTAERLPELLGLAEETGAGFLRKFDAELPGTIDELERRLGVATRQ